MSGSQSVNLIDYLKVLRRRRWVVAISAAVSITVVLAGGILDLKRKPDKASVSLEVDSSNIDLMGDLVEHVKADGTLSFLKTKFGLSVEEFRNKIGIRVEGNKLILESSANDLPEGVLNDLGEAARVRYYQLRDARINSEMGSVKEELASIGRNIDMVNQGLEELKSVPSEERILMLGYMNTLIKLQDRRDLLQNKLTEIETLKKATAKIISSDGFMVGTVKKTSVRIISASVISFIASLWLVWVLEYIDKKNTRRLTTMVSR